jgi:simple sugar transport system permease protein
MPVSRERRFIMPAPTRNIAGRPLIYDLGEASVVAVAVAWVPLGLIALVVRANEGTTLVLDGHVNILLRTGAIVAGSALMGMAGGFLTLAAFNAFYFNMVNGRGWVCVALVVFASWRPGKALLGALLFAFFDALQLRLQQAGGGVLGLELPYQFYLMLPYAMAIVALVLVARRAAYPQALMKPYRKGER